MQALSALPPSVCRGRLLRRNVKGRQTELPLQQVRSARPSSPKSPLAQAVEAVTVKERSARKSHRRAGFGVRDNAGALPP